MQIKQRGPSSAEGAGAADVALQLSPREEPRVDKGACGWNEEKEPQRTAGV